MKFRSVIAFVAIAGGCLSDAQAADSGAAAATQIRAALAKWTAAANRGDYKTALEVWAPDLIGWSPQGPDDSYEREARYANLPPQAPNTTYALTINEVIVDGSLAVVRDTWTQTTKQPSATDKVDTFRSFEVWRRQPDRSWKISRWIDGPLQPAAH